ncbi:MAG: hypothetical protein U1G08_04030 [Verrucomicrobiota bacterium]
MTQNPNTFRILLFIVLALLFQIWANASISLTQPLANSSFSTPNEISFEAKSSRSGTKVLQLTLLTDGIAVRTDSGLLSGTWPNVSKGYHALAVRATYEDGAVEESIAVPIVVQPTEVRLPPTAFLAVETIPHSDYRPILTPAMVELQTLTGDPNPNGKVTNAALFIDGVLFERKPFPSSGYLFALKNYLSGTDEVFTLQFQNNYGVLLTTNLDVPFQRATFYSRKARANRLRGYFDRNANAYLAAGEVIYFNGNRDQIRFEGKQVNVTAVGRDGLVAGNLSDGGPTTAFRLLNGTVQTLDTHPGCTPLAVSTDTSILLNQTLPDGTLRALLWKGDAVSELSGFPAGALVNAANMNDRGEVVGHYLDANNTSHAFLWRDGIATDLVVPTPGVAIEPLFINNLGVVVGNIDSREFRWKDGVFEELPTGGFQDVQITGLNNPGWMIGVGRNGNETVALLDRGDGWQPLQSILPQWLGNLSRTSPSGLNDEGCMYVYSSSGTFLVYPKSRLPELTLEVGRVLPNGITVFPDERITGVDILNQRSKNLVDWETWGTNVLGFVMPAEDSQMMYRVVPVAQ